MIKVGQTVVLGFTVAYLIILGLTKFVADIEPSLLAMGTPQEGIDIAEFGVENIKEIMGTIAVTVLGINNLPGRSNGNS